MTKRQWTTPEQRTLLDSLLPEFVAAQKSRTASTHFYRKAYAAWETKYPYPQPTEEEINAAAADMHQKAVNKAQATNQPIPAADTSSEHREGLRKALLATEKKNQEKRIFEWFHNHSRVTTSGTNKRSILKLTASRPLQDWQAFGKMFSDELKDVRDAGYTAYLQSLPPSEKPKTKLAWSMAFLKDRLENASEDVKAEVEEFRMNGSTSEEQSSEERNKGYQDAIDRLPRTLQLLCDSVVEKAGWSIMILAGGPHGRMGTVSNMVVQGGSCPSDGKQFTDTMSTQEFEENILTPWEEYLESMYPSEVCKDRVLKPWAGTEPDSPIDISSDDESEDSSKDLKATMVFMPNKSSDVAITEATTVDSAPTNATPTEMSNGRAKLRAKSGQSGRKGRKGKRDAVEPELESTPSSPSQAQQTVASATSAATTTSATTIDSTEATTPEATTPTTVTAATGAEAATDDATSTIPHIAPEASVVETQSINAQAPLESPEMHTPTNPLEPATLVTTLATDDSPEALLGHVECLPDWARTAFNFFHNITVAENSKNTWTNLVTEWVKFEVGANASGEGTSRGSSLPTKSRPEEIGWWMKRKRMFTNIPKVCSTEYSISFGAWWREIQPRWRTENDADGNTLTRNVPLGAHWDKMPLGGHNGMFLVILALAFWALAPDAAATQEAFDGAVDDVAWTFKAMGPPMLSPTVSSPGKRVLEDITSGKALSKRRRTRK
ncbi:hypothetical protein H0H92_002020 [Tricholoma furcatifolium]|nr:hypothetical protein H0H92_002020 [Tricholoma furcatifolium]